MASPAIAITKPEKKRWTTVLLSSPITRDWLNAFGLALAALVFLVAIIGPFLEPHSPVTIDLSKRMAAPSSQFWFGTDDSGRDMLSRVVWGIRTSFFAGLGIVALAVAIGTIIGVASGYIGGWVDELLMRITDMFLAFPALVLAMGLVAALGGSLFNAILATALVWWPWFARLVRGQALNLRGQAFVEAARVAGVSDWVIIYRHILPNTLPPLLVQSFLSMGYAILTLANLGFIGLGAQPPTPELGTMVASYQAFYLDQWWLVTFPGLAIVITVIAFNLLGEGLREVIAPRMRRQI